MDYTINQAAEPPADDPNANTANYDASADEGSFILPEVTTVMSDVNNFFQAQLLPRCREIESVCILLYKRFACITMQNMVPLAVRGRPASQVRARSDALSAPPYAGG